MNQTDSLENMKQQTTSNIENLNVDPKTWTENQSSKKKKIIIIITIVILILAIIALIIFIVLKKRGDKKDINPDPTDDTTNVFESDSFSIDISDSSSNSDEFPKISDSVTEDVPTSTIPKTDSSETIPTIIIESNIESSSDSI